MSKGRFMHRFVRGRLSLDNTINHYLSFGFTLLLVVALGIGVLAYLSAQAWLTAVNARSHSNEILKQTGQIFSTIQDAETGQRGYVLTGRDQYLAPYTAAMTILPQELDQLEALVNGDARQELRITQLRALVRTKLTELQTTVDLRRTAGFAAAQQVVLTDHGHQIMEDIRQVVTVIEEQETITFQTYGSQTTASAQHTLLLFVVLIVVDVVLVALMSRLMQRDTLIQRRVNDELEKRVRARTTELDETNWHLRTSEQRYRTLMEHFPNGAVMLFDHDLRYTVANGTALDTVGLSKSSLEGRTLMEVLPPATSHALEPAYRAALAGVPQRMERTSDGRVFDVHIVPVRDIQGAIQAGMVVSHDITERKQAEQKVVCLNTELEERVRQRTAQLEAANKELEAFSYSVSHDLRSPLRSIDGFSQALLEDYGDQLDAMAHGYLSRIRAATTRMAQLIDDMLNLSRVSRSDMYIAPVDMSAVAQQVIAELHKSQPERDVEVVIAPDLVVNADTRLLRIMLDNLLGNAWKFTRKHADARIEVSATTVDDEQVYFVRDNGVGFDMTYAGKLFGAFQRLHAATDFEGTGVGLATVQRIIRRHGGRIWAEAAVNEGATFFFTFCPSGTRHML